MYLPCDSVMTGHVTVLHDREECVCGFVYRAAQQLADGCYHGWRDDVTSRHLDISDDALCGWQLWLQPINQTM
jgi:hypothetical protein